MSGQLLPASPIDWASPVPFYFRLAELLEHEIVSGRWPPRFQLPAEPEIGRYFGLSRTTVRQGLARLEEGLIQRRLGQGTFVEESRPRSWLLQLSEGFSEEAGRLGRHVTSRVLRREQGPLPQWACDALDLPAGGEGITLERLRSVDGLVALYVVDHLPAAFAETVLSLDAAQESLYERLYAREGIEVYGGWRVLESVAAGDGLANLLDVGEGAPLAFIESVSWDRDLRPFDCYRAWLRTDRMRVEVQVASAPLAVGQRVQATPGVVHVDREEKEHVGS